jgi:glycosyltransferase involved in cell wall biosynthesis
MKVLHVIPSISPLRGGPSQAVIEMVRALRQQGIDACVVATQDNGKYRNPDLPTNTWFNYMDIPLFLHQCIDSRFRALREYQVSLSLISWLYANIKEYDIVHFHAIFSFPTTIGMLVARYKRIPYIVRTIGQLNSWSLQQGAFKKKLMLECIERGNLENAKAIHVTSKYELDDIRLLGLSNRCINLGVGVVIPQEACTNNKYPQNKEHKIRFLFLSRIHPKKQLELLFESLEILKYEYHENGWELVIAGSGDGHYIKQLRNTSNQRRIQEHLVWMGHVTGGDKENVLRTTDWFVLLSSSENFGISAVEAMAASLPIIITANVGISKEVLEYNAGFICKESPKEIAQVFKFILNNSVHETMGLSARRLVEENYSWIYISKSLLKIYKTYSHKTVFSEQ